VPTQNSESPPKDAPPVSGGSGSPGGVKKVWVWVLVPVVALGAIGFWLVSRGRPSGTPGDEAQADLRPSEEARTRARAVDPVGYVKLLAKSDDPATMNELMQVYSKWAAYPETVEARRLALATMLRNENAKVAMDAVLTAVEGDQTPRDQDPLWPDLVKGVSKLWNAMTFQVGRDQVYVDERAKPRDVLLESLAEADLQKLTDQQRSQLAADLIDLYPGLKASQRPAVDRQLVALAGTDVVDILAGRGIHNENSQLNIVAEKNQAAQAARAIRVPKQVVETE
jgi:hypothetical protein